MLKTPYICTFFFFSQLRERQRESTLCISARDRTWVLMVLWSVIDSYSCASAFLSLSAEKYSCRPNQWYLRKWWSYTKPVEEGVAWRDPQENLLCIQGKHFFFPRYNIGTNNKLVSGNEHHCKNYEKVQFLQI